MAQKILSSVDMKIEHFYHIAKLCICVEQSSSPILYHRFHEQENKSTKWKSSSGSDINPVEKNNTETADHRLSPSPLVKHKLIGRRMKILKYSCRRMLAQTVYWLFKSLIFILFNIYTVMFSFMLTRKEISTSNQFLIQRATSPSCKNCNL